MDNEVIKRLVMIRKTLDLKQGVFAQTMGIPQTTLSTIENGKSPLQERHIKLICLTFNVNETWLRTGEGDMFSENTPDERELLSIFRSLSDSMCNLYLKIGYDILANQPTEPTPPAL
jgi:transcriptional regulator with XRE-family HTH domain